MRNIIVIGDLQIKPGVNLNYLKWIGTYIADKRPDVIVQIGDAADFPSLSSYDKKGSHSMEGRRLKADIESVKKGMDILMEPIHKARGYHPELHLTIGNHEDRLTRMLEENPQMQGVVGLEDLEYEKHGFIVHEYLKPVVIEGVVFTHYVSSPGTGRAVSGAQKIAQVMRKSTICGHNQNVTHAYIPSQVPGEPPVHTAVIGASYTHQEKYLGPQGNNHWRGILRMVNTHKGEFDPLFISLHSLERRFKEKHK